MKLAALAVIALATCHDPFAPSLPHQCHKEGRLIGYITAYFGPDSSITTAIYADTSSSWVRVVCK